MQHLPPPRFSDRSVSSVPRMPPPMNNLPLGATRLESSLARPRNFAPISMPPYIPVPGKAFGLMMPGFMPPMVPRGVTEPRYPMGLRLWNRKISPPMQTTSRFAADNNSNVQAVNNTKVDKLGTHPHPDNEGDNETDEINAVEDTLYYCAICDRDFSSEDALAEHKSTHSFCGIDGCKFSAHPLLVEKHIRMQHSTGLYASMKDLSEEGDAKKWTEERKKRFPTKSNIKLREVEDIEKFKRGEIIKQDLHTFKTTKTMNTRGKKRKAHRRLAQETVNDSHVDESYRGVRSFPGTKILREEYSSKACLDEETAQTDVEDSDMENNSGEEKYDISDEDDDLLQTSVKPKLANLSVPSLVANYESEEDSSPEEAPIKNIKMEDLQDHKIVEKNITVHEEISNNAQSCTNTRKNKSSRQTIVNETSRHPKRQDKQNHKKSQKVEDKKQQKNLTRHYNTLLQKLLSRSIQHERNLIFQCMKYIVENNFFESSGCGT
ncbi:PREDICTED: nuclear fragile X mental retardation-interacting protein 1 [Dinoponera quadriceps]|uniref:Nuclear fragile X mental retardation-interacting protein 1 n=1 Tax=Dinoponera quadriceps TaxID=609295 RepID=A0A6P3YFP6_DINQU|nr:PREDICTED: nuclear fragile X mental retardation-interacting protein 1 [Dinoponera quadriceps]XP_014488710.1 PREDICTED: nuclear fragile X mental retardation-interacting protein 1 [Dinoponera quadriceps]